MHPAPSIIVFTVLSGLGLGMIAWIGVGVGSGESYGWIAVPTAFVITGLGGIVSVGHLGRPDRAWRAFSQWQSSWLSREAVLMVASMGAFAVYAALWLLNGQRLAALGWVSALLSVTTIYATAKIYAQLKTVPRWSSTPTPAMFVLLSLASGYIAVAAVIGAAGLIPPFWWSIAALYVSGFGVLWWNFRASQVSRGQDGSTLETAIGLFEGGRARMLEPPHTGQNYLLKEMAYQIGRRRVLQLRKAGIGLGYVLPLVCALGAIIFGGWLLVPMIFSHILGLLALRWLFFAEAEHVQALYYGHN